MLVISYETQNLRDSCLSLENAESSYGSLQAQELIEILADADAVDDAEEFIELYSGSDCVVVKDSISLKIGSEYSMTLTAIGENMQVTVTGEIVWSSVTRLKLMMIKKCP